MYTRSHFTKALELMILLIAYEIYGSADENTSYAFLTFSMWFLVTSWLYAPFLFNPMGFEWQKIVEDWEDWTKWIGIHGGIGVPANKSCLWSVLAGHFCRYGHLEGQNPSPKIFSEL
ncbi:hypothetical protein FNV43_RR18875 [Rhamnella rubrinervis]|uniref:Glycosyl transferase 48 domain-containing protein n=1 Tax=Rhamnella rubrinervis TaxID=2594499 RepID=A0A8K0GWG6_9ROSA|nr:hypothetical protein FNV43_RR18875 [Rhamnella rubrinervis]